MNVEEIIEEALSPNQGLMAIMNEDGDKKTVWDRTRPVEVEAARREFDYLRVNGYLAFKVEGSDGRKGEVLHEFDPKAERIIFSPRMVGG